MDRARGSSGSGPGQDPPAARGNRRPSDRSESSVTKPESGSREDWAGCTTPGPGSSPCRAVTGGTVPRKSPRRPAVVHRYAATTHGTLRNQNAVCFLSNSDGKHATASKHRAGTRQFCAIRNSPTTATGDGVALSDTVCRLAEGRPLDGRSRRPDYKRSSDANIDKIRSLISMCPLPSRHPARIPRTGAGRTEG